MHVGTATLFQNPNKHLPDSDVYLNELRLADLAEPLGFDSIWGTEHHFTDYMLCPDVLQFLSYMAGRTERIKLGSLVVLPWHDPVRVAEELVMLDIMSGGRVIVGVERGVARVEHEGFRLDLSESRGRFVESAQMLVSALESGYAEFDGEFAKQPKVEIRPSPSRSFRGRTYAAAISPESSVLLGILGLGMLVVPQKSWSETQAALVTYRSTYRERNQEEPIAPVVTALVYCHEDESRATEMANRYIGAHWDSIIQQFGLRNGDRRGTRSYANFNTFSDDMTGYGQLNMRDEFIGVHVSGTPDQCYKKIMDIVAYTDANALVAVFSYAGMPYDEAERSMRLFAEVVMPELKSFGGVPTWN